MRDDEVEQVVPEDPGRLIVTEFLHGKADVGLLLQYLRDDLVVLIRHVTPEQADEIMYEVAEGFSLNESLKLHTVFAGFLGHRHNIGEYFMSVNDRNDYQFVTPHSEGSSFIGMQLASFFCYENSTDGGETILFNTDDTSEAWQSLREKLTRGRIGPTPLTPQQSLRAKALYRLDLPADLLKDDDRILRENKTAFPGLTVVDVLAKPKRTYSRILDREVCVYWDSIGSVDGDSSPQFKRLLKLSGLLKEPSSNGARVEMDSGAERRVWRSGISYSQLFKCKITHKLAAGDLIIQNNMTWAHSATNWSPGSGTRKIVASFA
jgi:hypothetical protein